MALQVLLIVLLFLVAKFFFPRRNGRYIPLIDAVRGALHAHEVTNKPLGWCLRTTLDGRRNFNRLMKEEGKTVLDILDVYEGGDKDRENI